MSSAFTPTSPLRQRFRPLLWLAIASEQRATILCSPNFGYRHYLKVLGDRSPGNLDLSSVRLIFNGASEEQVYEKWRSICADDLAAADAYCADLPPLPAPSFDVGATAAAIRDGSMVFNGDRKYPDPINLAFAFDDNLTGIMPAALESAIANLSRPAVVHVLARGIDHAFWEDFVRDFPETAFRIFDFDRVDYGSELNLVKRTTPSTIDRLLLPDLLPEIDRIVYLDVDIVVQGDLARLYDIDMADRPLAARSSTKGWRTGHDVLDRGDRRCGGKAEDGAEVGIADLRGDRAVFADRAVVVQALEDDAAVGLGRIEGDRYGRAGMDARPGNRHRAGNRRLETEHTDRHLHSPYLTIGSFFADIVCPGLRKPLAGRATSADFHAGSSGV